MKLTNISLAVLTALALTACGGSDSDATDNSNKMTQEQKNAAEAAKKKAAEEAAKKKAAEEAAKKKAAEEAAKKKAAEEAAKKKAAAGSSAGTNGNATVEVGDGVAQAAPEKAPPVTEVADAGVKQTVGAAQYRRGPKSELDLLNNPRTKERGDNPDSGTYVYSKILDKRLENFLGAQVARANFSDKKDDAYNLYYYLGKYDANKFDENYATTNLQNENVKNVDLGKKGFDGDLSIYKVRGGNGDLVMQINGARKDYRQEPDFVDRDIEFARRGIVVEGFNSVVGNTLGRDDSINSNTTTRVFGHLHLNNKDDAPVNSYKEPTVTTNKVDGFYGLVAKPQQLKYVQYGRVTGNFDLHKGDDNLPYSLAQLESGNYFKQTSWDNRQNPEAVSYYFSRGVDHTAFDSKTHKMKGINQAEINYYGHAITYGFPGGVVTNDQAGPNAMGGIEGIAIGDFVKANFKVADAKVTGSIYRGVLNNPYDKDSYENKDLVTFTGKVDGNTVIGTSANVVALKDQSKVGTFHASFFGPGAAELGGTVNSVQDLKYGKGNNWGGVFGAKAVIPAAKPKPAPTPAKPNIDPSLEAH